MKTGLKSSPTFIVLLLVLVSCVNLKQLNDYSSNSLTAISKFEDINYSFKQHCLEDCQFNALKKLEIKRDNQCDCSLYNTADSVTQVIYNSIKGYFNGLNNLSNNDLTTYNTDALKKSLTTGNFGGVKIDSSEVAAYSKISVILLKATTDVYRKRKLKDYIEEANSPLQILLTKFQFILQSNLEGELNWKKDDLYRYYNKLMETKLSEYEKQKVTTDYYQQLTDILSKQKQITAFTKSIEVIATGHKQLYEKRNDISSTDLKKQLTQYASNIKDLVSEFNKLKK